MLKKTEMTLIKIFDDYWKSPKDTNFGYYRKNTGRLSSEPVQ